MEKLKQQEWRKRKEKHGQQPKTFEEAESRIRHTSKDIVGTVVDVRVVLQKEDRDWVHQKAAT